MLKTVDRLEITVVVDNVTDAISSNKAPAASVTTEFTREFQANFLNPGSVIMGEDCYCCAAHGLSLLLTAHVGGERRSVIFDAGPADYAFQRNAFMLGLDLGGVEGVVVSHGHWDHIGGIGTAVALIRQANGGRPVPVYMHPDMFAARALKHPAGGPLLRLKDIPSEEGLRDMGAEPVVTREPMAVADGAFWISGEIPRTTPFEPGMPGQLRLDDAGEWQDDAITRDERFVAVRIKDKGIAVFTACSHAGVVNVMRHARERFPDDPLALVMGGFHLSGPSEAIIAPTVDGLASLDIDLFAPGHCTGWRAVNVLAARFGDERVIPSAVGKIYTI